MALNVTPEQLQLTLPTDQTKVFVVVMDWDLGDNIDNIENKTSEWLSLFENANNVITELRLTTEKK